LKKTSTTSRILAALALLGAIAAVLIVLSSQTGESDPAGNPAAKQGKKAKAGNGDRPAQQGGSRGAKIYEVQEGDSLTAIAEQTGVPIELIEELNPEVDPQALIPGQKLKLR
jgi:LysM repeat protein